MITFGVPAYREAKTIGHKIRDLLRYGLNEKFEIIVATPDTETANEVKKFKDKRVKLIFEGKREGQFAAYEKILKTAKGEIIVFTDADAEIVPGSVEKILAVFKDKNVGAAGSRIVLPKMEDNMFAFWARLLYFLAHKHRLNAVNSGIFYSITGGLCAVRKSAMPGIPNQLIHSVTSVDTTVGLLVRNNGYEVVYVPEAKVCQKFVNNVSDFIKQKRRSMAGHYIMKDWFKLKKVRTLSSEASEGLSESFRFCSRPKEYLWLLALILVRGYTWLLAYYDAKIAKKGIELWVPIESTK